MAPLAESPGPASKEKGPNGTLPNHRLVFQKVTGSWRAACDVLTTHSLQSLKETEPPPHTCVCGL